jgi:hypothetical protein
LDADRLIPPTQDEVHNALIGREAILKRHFLWENIHSVDRLGREITDFVEAGDTASIQEHDRLAVAPSADLRSDLLEHFFGTARAKGADRPRSKLNLRGNVGHDGSSQSFA